MEMRTVLVFLILLAAALFCVPPGSSLHGGGGVLAARGRSVELQVMSQNRFLAGSIGSLRILAYNPSSMKGVGEVPVRISLEQEGKVIPLGAALTDSRGTVSRSFRLPSRLKGSAALKVEVRQESSSGQPVREEVTIPVVIQQERKIYLTTDKPLYQPSQVIHLRALSLSIPTLQPVGGETMTFEVEDSKGNKVFKRRAQTSRFGIASVEFELADEVNLGEYHVRGILQETQVERSIQVKKYVLPKFKVSIGTGKTFYLPGETVKGTVQARYFFGKPVTQAAVQVAVSTFDVSLHKIGEIKGKTSQDGTFAFEFPLPRAFVGQPVQKGKAMVQFDAEVTDGAKHKEKGSQTYPVSVSSISLEAVPERGALVPGIPNIIYLLASYPDGTPAPALIRVGLTGSVKGEAVAIKTDELGFAQTEVTPSGTGMILDLEATDKKGNRAKLQVPLSVQPQGEFLVVRPSRGIYKAGEELLVQLLSSRKFGNVYLDLLSNGQTFLTRSVELTGGRGKLSLPLSPDLAGVVELHAYQILPSGEIVRDSRRVVVQPARELTIRISLDRSSYRPGEEARLGFQVRDRAGRPVLSAIGVDIVDESLFALAERQPGLERVYFLLEKELAEPRYEIHGVGLSDLFLKPAQKEKLASPLLTKVPATPEPYPFQYNSYTKKLEDVSGAISRVSNAAYRYFQKFHRSPGSTASLVRNRFLKGDEARDPWGRLLILELLGAVNQTSWKIYSIGPDGIPGTEDDIGQEKISRLLYGGGFGGRRRDMLFEMAEDRAVPMPANAPREGMVMLKSRVAGDEKKQETGALGGKDQAGTRVREFFPETLLTRPELLTNEWGAATLTVPLADSITTWRISSFASSLHGEMGNQSGTLRVFQDFFVDLDLPVSLTQGDIISIPVAIYNYLPAPQAIEVTLKKEPWFSIRGGEKKVVRLGKNEVISVSFTIAAERIGTFPLTVYAKGSKMSDAIKKSIQVLPNGEEHTITFSDRLVKDELLNVVVPKNALADASKILVTIYPGLLSQVLEGMDSIFQMPFGCFEQTSSTTYPNVLVLDYLKKIRKITPEIQMKAEGYINTGYQRLLTFEVKGVPGAFSVFGQAPGNEILTAYGLMEFSDMAKVYDVDPALLARTAGWLIGRQQKDGSWAPGSQGFYAEGWSNIPNSSLPSTAYVTWALAESERASSGSSGGGAHSSGPGAAVQGGIRYIKAHLGEAKDSYTLSLCANALAAANPKEKVTQEALGLLARMAKVEGEKAFWHSTISTATYGTGTPADVETTALATLALMRGDYDLPLAGKAINFLAGAKDPRGTWHSTQATVLAMKAMIASLEKGSEKMHGQGEILLNGKRVQAFAITPEDYDLFRQFDLGVVQNGKNQVSITFDGKAAVYYKVTGRYFLPWQKGGEKAKELSIDLSYDRTTLHTNDQATAKVLITNNLGKSANMVIVDLGIPPGFEVNSGDLEGLVSKRVIERFSLTGRQIIVYLEKIDPKKSLEFSYRLKAKYPIKAKSPASTVYEYYNPQVKGMEHPVEIVVQ